MERKVYFAGEIFDHKHLIGNRLLADAISAGSQGRYRPVLPQETELPEHRAVAIRNHDFKLLLESDAALFNFDGADLDSGTVVEFIAAKMLDIPAVIIRTDFRHAGDQESGGDAWNLMCSGYPRTVGLTLNSMEIYQRHLRQNEDSAGLLSHLYQETASAVIAKLDEVTLIPPLLDNQRDAMMVYQWFVKAIGGGMEAMLGAQCLERIVASRK